MSEPQPLIARESLVRRHLVFGWWSLLVYLALGIGLEAMHGFKVGWYLDVGHETRRLLFTLAHAHGTVLALVHLGFAFTSAHVASGAAIPSHSAHRARSRWSRVASPTLLAASVLLPAGFFLGGLVTYGSDPGPGIFLVPLGALLLLVGVAAAALVASRSPIA